MRPSLQQPAVDAWRPVRRFQAPRFALTYPISYQNVNNWSPYKYIDNKQQCAIQFSSQTGCRLQAVSKKSYSPIAA